MTDTRSSPGTELPQGTFASLVVKRMQGLIETANKSSAWEMEAVAEMMKAVHLITRGVAQAASEPAITDAMVEAGARVAATRRGHKDCDHLVATVNAGRVPVWEFYTEEPRAILEAALALSSTEGK
jgi:hypothetical protein